MPERAKKESNQNFPSELFDLLAGNNELELQDVDILLDELQLLFQPGMMAASPAVAALKAAAKPTSLLDAPFTLPIQKYPGQVAAVTLGATKKDGGSRGKTVTIGGEKSPAFYTFENPTLNPPVVSFDVFDSKTALPRSVRNELGDAYQDPVSWAKFVVDKLGADMVTLHLVSIDPLNPKPATPAEAVRTVEDVLQAVDVPLVVGGCGDPEKDLAVFEKVTAACEGERLLISTITLDMDIEKSAKLVEKHGHVALAFSPMDLNQARELNRRLLEYIPKDRIIMDTTTAALGYGLDYAFTIMERARVSGLLGDPELQQPMSSGTTNAWAAREAWKTLDPEWGDKNLRGPLWEVVTGLTLMLAGVDLFMMLHPAAVKTLRNVIKRLTTSSGTLDTEKIASWVSSTL